MFGEYDDAQWVALAFVFLGIALMLALVVRRFVPWLAALYLPVSVIAGFLILLLGPQLLGAWTGGHGLFPQQAIDVLARLPGLLINVVFAGIMIGKRLPSVREIWQQSAPHVILGSVYSFGQFALGAFAVALVLGPLFGLPDAAASILELSFAGGHGTIAGMGGILENAGAPEVIDLGLGLATISMVTGVVGGSILVNYGMRSPRIEVARKHPARSGPLRLSEVEPNASDEQTTRLGLGSTGRAFAGITIAVAIGILILELLRLVTGAFGSDIFDDFPLFPFTVIGGFLVQLVLTLTRTERYVDRRSVNDITGLALDVLIAAAIGTMSLAALGSNIVSLVILTVIAVAWSVVGMLWLGPRIFPTQWFERSIADFGQSQGNVATGFVLADMADPERRTVAASGYGYKQLIYEPLLGGGLITAFSVPVVLAIGPLWFGAGAAVITAVLILWGIARVRHSR
ncbi:sodium/glutamate symporter [Protaetiibacter larvae]|uniref:Sodium:glutamate symporter n=1 Tax=Protaetiibacter larvae TaxID=2592654 RepID=A0A5C1Y7A9_9MICO|nr:sodium:glutamate symporter [Protaetiibacter larvae]QEO09055.1 sodium:glutamate symporter [Protaetiibacter larvae]